MCPFSAFQVFHVEFERVQLPFIISLWIFVSSLAKIGGCRELLRIFCNVWIEQREQYFSDGAAGRSV